MKEREANFELLRVIAIFMVLVLHYLSHAGGLLVLGDSAAPVQLVGQLIESFCIVAVNVWVLISGYFLSKSKFKVSRILQLVCEIYFYTILVTFVMNLVHSAGATSDDVIYKTTQFLFPISSEHYSFATAYVILYVLAPILNKGIEYMARREMKITISALLVVFCFIKSIIPVNFATDKMGYDFGWYIVLYLIGAYIRKYDVRILNGKKSSLLLYIFSALASFLIAVIFHNINLNTGRFNYYATVPLHYNFLLCLTGALGLFSAFRYVTVQNRKISKAVRFLAPFSFGVYLLHEHLEIRDRWVTWICAFIGDIPNSVFAYIVHMIVSVIIVFVCCVFVDFVRKNIFEYVSRKCQNTRLFKFIRSLDENFKRARE